MLHHDPSMKEAPSTTRLSDHLVLGCLVGTYLLTAVHKFQRDSVIFLLQPCHMSLMILILTLILPRENRKAHVIFNLYLQVTWGTLLALLVPDLRDYSAFLEVENFFFGRS